MTKIQVPDYSFTNDVEITKEGESEEYKKLEEECEAKLEKDRAHYAKVYKNAKKCMARSGAEQSIQNFMQKLESGEFQKDICPQTDEEFIITEERIHLELEKYDRLLKSGILEQSDFINYKDNRSELGGFAQFPEDIDGDYEAFNRCLANEYINAMLGEDFLALGELSISLLNTIWDWNDSWEIDKSTFMNGTFITCKNRTFIDAIIETHAYQAGEAFFHVNNPKFLAMMIAYSESYEYILSYAFHENLNEEEWNKMIQTTLEELNNIYGASKEEEKKEILLKAKKTVQTIFAPKEFRTCEIPSNTLTKKLIKNI